MCLIIPFFLRITPSSKSATQKESIFIFSKYLEISISPCPYAIPVKKSHDIITTSKSSDIIAIDEAQFFDEDIIKVCKSL